MNCVDKYYFHESTILCFEKRNNDIFIVLDDVSFKNRTIKVAVEVLDVANLIIDEDELSTVDIPLNLMEYQDGEVLSLNIYESSLIIIVEWNDFSKRISRTMSYDISGDLIHVLPIT